MKASRELRIPSLQQQNIDCLTILSLQLSIPPNSSKPILLAVTKSYSRIAQFKHYYSLSLIRAKIADSSGSKSLPVGFIKLSIFTGLPLEDHWIITYILQIIHTRELRKIEFYINIAMLILQKLSNFNSLNLFFSNVFFAKINDCLRHYFFKL